VSQRRLNVKPQALLSSGKEQRAITESAVRTGGRRNAPGCRRQRHAPPGEQRRRLGHDHRCSGTPRASRAHECHLNFACFSRSGRRRKIEHAQEDSEPFFYRGEEVVRGHAQRRQQQLRGGASRAWSWTRPHRRAASKLRRCQVQRATHGTDSSCGDPCSMIGQRMSAGSTSHQVLRVSPCCRGRPTRARRSARRRWRRLTGLGRQNFVVFGCLRRGSPRESQRCANHPLTPRGCPFTADPLVHVHP
jgi:hypothetical protein